MKKTKIVCTMGPNTDNREIEGVGVKWHGCRTF